LIFILLIALLRLLSFAFVRYADRESNIVYFEYDRLINKILPLKEDLIEILLDRVFILGNSDSVFRNGFRRRFLFILRFIRFILPSCEFRFVLLFLYSELDFRTLIELNHLGKTLIIRINLTLQISRLGYRQICNLLNQVTKLRSNCFILFSLLLLLRAV
jgi:hypothetical protein